MLLLFMIPLTCYLSAVNVAKIQPGDNMIRIVKARFMGNNLHIHGTSLVGRYTWVIYSTWL